MKELAYVKREIGYLDESMADGYAPVEFGAKLDVSIDSDGYARIEKTSFPPLGGITTCPRGLYQTASRAGGTDYANNRI